MTSINETPIIETDVLIVGTGPAGGSLACFLCYHGITGLIISRDASTAIQPRAHYTNQATWECLRDIGLETEWRKVSHDKQLFGDHRFCFTLTGPDIIRYHSVGSHPQHSGEYQEASPCAHADVPQNVGEPILTKFATQHGFRSRFNCRFLQYEQDPTTGMVVSTIQDQLMGNTFKVISKYLCGADGANSLVARQAGLPFHDLGTAGLALNVWYEADLSHIYGPNPGLLHSVLTPDVDAPDWGAFGINRMIRPHQEYIMVLIARPGVTECNASDDEVVNRLRQMIGDPSVKIKLNQISRWRINECYAQVLSKDNQIFCLGDAIHRHPPGNGLGLNTSIQDAYNLAWKLAYVLQGKADASLLSSYTLERQPIGKRIVRIANDVMRDYGSMTLALGLHEPTVEARLATLKRLGEATSEGATQRDAVSKAYDALEVESTGIGGELNQAYVSNAISAEDEPDANPGWDDATTGVRHHTISTYPGSRLPHAWLGTSKFGEKISTHDLAGKSHFTLFTGVGGGEAWSEAARAAERALESKVVIKVRSIGFGQEFADLYRMWQERRGVEEDGAVLVRPDRTVAWRSNDLNDVAVQKLSGVMRTILGF